MFYQGPRGWSHSTEFADLFPEAVRSLPWVPRFTHELLDQTTLEPETVAGGVKGRITQLLVMVAFGRHVEAVLDRATHWFLLLGQAEGGVDEFRRCIVYLTAAQDREVVEAFGEALRRHGLERGGDIMTYAEELLAEGEAKGKVETLLRQLERRFDVVPEAVAARVRAATASDLDAILDARDLDGVFQDHSTS